MKRLCSGGAPRNGSKETFASLVEPFPDFAFLIKQPLKSRQNLIQAQKYFLRSTRLLPIRSAELTSKPSPPVAGEGRVRGQLSKDQMRSYHFSTRNPVLSKSILRWDLVC